MEEPKRVRPLDYASPPLSRRRWPWIVLAAVVLLLLVQAAVWFLVADVSAPTTSFPVVAPQPASPGGD